MRDQQEDRVLQAFTTQADSFTHSAVVAVEEARRCFVEFVGPLAGDCVLDVATGPGFLAFPDPSLHHALCPMTKQTTSPILAPLGVKHQDCRVWQPIQAGKWSPRA